MLVFEGHLFLMFRLAYLLLSSLSLDSLVGYYSKCAVVGLPSMLKILNRCTGTFVSERSNSLEVPLEMMESSSSKE